MDQAQLLKELKDRTGLPFMKCKAALIEARWDLQEALKKPREEYWQKNPFILRST